MKIRLSFNINYISYCIMIAEFTTLNELSRDSLSKEKSRSVN